MQDGMDFHIVVSEEEEADFPAFLQAGIREFNNRASPPHLAVRQPGARRPLHLMVKDAAGNLLGGLSGSTYWNWLEVDDLFLLPQLRGQGMGAALLQRAQDIAARRGCSACFLTTYEFQARAFYEHHGFRVVGRLEGYPPGSCYYWMRKDFPSQGA